MTRLLLSFHVVLVDPARRIPFVSDDVSIDGFIEECEAAPRPLTEATIKRLVGLFYALAGNGAGGALHIVLDDNNWEREHVEWCRGNAVKADDKAAIRMADVLIELSDEQLRAWLGGGHCSHCSADHGDDHVDQAFTTPDGRCPECGSWSEGHDS